LGPRRIKGSGEEDGILNYINYMSQIWLNILIKINRLKREGHVIRMDNNRTNKRMLDNRRE
jgi:hypothetical protein